MGEKFAVGKNLAQSFGLNLDFSSILHNNTFTTNINWDFDTLLRSSLTYNTILVTCLWIYTSVFRNLFSYEIAQLISVDPVVYLKKKKNLECFLLCWPGVRTSSGSSDVRQATIWGYWRSRWRWRVRSWPRGQGAQGLRRCRPRLLKKVQVLNRQRLASGTGEGVRAAWARSGCTARRWPRWRVSMRYRSAAEPISLGQPAG